MDRGRIYIRDFGLRARNVRAGTQSFGPPPPPPPPPQTNPASAPEHSETLSISGPLSGQRFHSLKNEFVVQPKPRAHICFHPKSRNLYSFTFQLSLGTNST